MSTKIDLANRPKDLSEAEIRSRLPAAPQFDARFPNQNQERACYSNFVDYHRCIKIKGEDFEDCNYFKGIYQALCATSIIEKREEAMEKGCFPSRFAGI